MTINGLAQPPAEMIVMRVMDDQRDYHRTRGSYLSWMYRQYCPWQCVHVQKHAQLLFLKRRAKVFSLRFFVPLRIGGGGLAELRHHRLDLLP